MPGAVDVMMTPKGLNAFQWGSDRLMEEKPIIGYKPCLARCSLLVFRAACRFGPNRE